MRIFVTGASGFLGGHLVEHLVERGHEPVCLVRPRSDRSVLSALMPRVRLVEGDLADEGALRAALEDADAVIHAAALTRKVQQKRDDLFRTNAHGTARLLDACAARDGGPPRFVLVSSMSAVGPTAGPVREDQACRPLTDYGASKRAAEKEALRRKDRLPVCIVRLPGLYGPRDPNLIRLFRLVARGLRPAGRRGVPFLHVRDAAQALLAAAEHPAAAGEIFHAAGEPLTLSDVGRAVAAALGTRAVPVPLPAGLLFVAGAATELAGLLLGRSPFLDVQKARDLAADWQVSTEKIRARLGWAARVTFAEGMREAAAWYKAAGWL